MKRAIWVMALVAGMGAIVQADIVVTSAVSGQQLADEIVGAGVTISNVTYTGVLSAGGTFTGGLDAGIGIDSGIVLTTGAVSNIGPVNTSDSITTDNLLAGDADLTALAGYATADATVLEFDFEVTGTQNIFFNYVFASDEYNEWAPSQYNDVFAFLLDGQNIALIPGTTDAVSINNINLSTNSAYYNSNDVFDPVPPVVPFAFEYDGFTDVFTAEYFGLAEGTHHMRLAIADSSDRYWDSGVFIQAGTFSNVPTPPGGTVPAPGAILLASLGVGCVNWLRRGRRL